MRPQKDLKEDWRIDCIDQKCKLLHNGASPCPICPYPYPDDEIGLRQKWREWLVRMIIALSSMIEGEMDAIMETLESPSCWENVVSNLATLRSLEQRCSVRG